MIHVCPKCGDYYADDLLMFCPTDGPPLLTYPMASMERWRPVVKKTECLERHGATEAAAHHYECDYDWSHDGRCGCRTV